MYAFFNMYTTINKIEMNNNTPLAVLICRNSHSNFTYDISINDSGVAIAFTKGNITETPMSSKIEPNNIIKNSPIIFHFCFVFKTYKYFFNKINVSTSYFYSMHILKIITLSDNFYNIQHLHDMCLMPNFHFFLQ